MKEQHELNVYFIDFSINDFDALSQASQDVSLSFQIGIKM